MELEVRLDAPRQRIHLHAVGLSVGRARARVQDRIFKATAEADAESETVTLRFDEELPRGNAILDLAWSGSFSPGLRGLYRAGPLAVTQFEAADARRVFPCFGVPDFEAGAMENAACITYREVALLLDPRTAPLNIQKRVAEVITHELAHQWFGNLVTMVWWDDLWLNEAFATWMAYKIVDQWRPQWRVWMDFEASKGAALHLDALKSSHPIRAEIHNAEEAGESFDAITYEKGGAILRMIEGYLGEEKFREGIRLYMRRHREGNATADDRWGALAAASGQPILELANGWIRQTGYPLITLSEQGGKVRLTQRRFFSDPEAAPEPTRWLVPVVLRIDGRERRVLLKSPSDTVDTGGKAGWVLANAGARGFYRAAYDADLLERLVSALPERRPEERMSLVSDQWALVRAGTVKLDALLTLVAGLADEEDHTVLDEVVGRLSWLEHRA